MTSLSCNLFETGKKKRLCKVNNIYGLGAGSARVGGLRI